MIKWDRRWSEDHPEWPEDDQEEKATPKTEKDGKKGNLPWRSRSARKYWNSIEVLRRNDSVLLRLGNVKVGVFKHFDVVSIFAGELSRSIFCHFFKFLGQPPHLVVSRYSELPLNYRNKESHACSLLPSSLRIFRWLVAHHSDLRPLLATLKRSAFLCEIRWFDIEHPAE